MFWYDADQEFEEGLSDLTLDGVNIVRLDELGSLEIKILLELQDTTGKYLIYAPYSEQMPRMTGFWIFAFIAARPCDQASILLNELV